MQTNDEHSSLICHSINNEWDKVLCQLYQENKDFFNDGQIQERAETPGGRVMKLFSSSLMSQTNKLNGLPLVSL
jgi:hypothetical protein